MRLLPLVAALLAALAGPARAADVGSVSGRVADRANGHAIPFAQVTLPLVKRGGLTDSEGHFSIPGVPPGTYEVRVQYLGYKPASQPAVVVVAGKAVTVNFSLESVVVKEEKVTEVSAARRLVEVRQGATVRNVTAGEIRNMAVTTVSDVLSQQAGITTEGDQIHVRGGRADEAMFVVDGVANRDLVTGQSTAGQLNARSVQDLNVNTGGFDVKRGNAISGVVEIKLKEGGDRLDGGVTAATGSYGGRYWQAQLAGPDPVWKPLLRLAGVRVPGSVSSILDFSGSFYESRFIYMNHPGLGLVDRTFYPPMLHDRLTSSYTDSWMGRPFRYSRRLFPSEENHWALRYGLTWKPNTNDKVTWSVSKRLDVDWGFSRSGVTVNGDLTDPTYPWSWNRRIEHAGTTLNDNLQSTMQWRHSMSATGWTELKLSRQFVAERRDVAGKWWWNYEEPDDAVFPASDPRSDRVFTDTGDASSWSDRRQRVWSVGWLLDQRFGHNDLEVGLDHDWQTVQFLGIEEPWFYDPNGLGKTHDQYLVHPWLGDVFVRDLLEFEGFKANVGLRADYWVLGREAEQALADTTRFGIPASEREGFYRDSRSLFGRRMKVHVSPRIMVSHPISEDSKFFFNYGQFTQVPQYRLVYAKLRSISSEAYPNQGNPNLNPKVSVNYEVGGEHQFTSTTAANITFFVRDVYDYPSATAVQRLSGSGSIETFFIYLNGHFSRSKGAEIVVEKRRSHHWSGKLQYSYQQTRGKSSDPNQDKALQEIGGSSALNLSEVFVNWNRPHKLNAVFDARWDKDAPRHWGALRNTGFNLMVQGQSGRAYTPQIYGPDQGLAKFSANGLFQFATDVKLNRWFRVGKRRYDISLTGTNIFDNRMIYRVNTATGGGVVWGEGGYDPMNPYDRLSAVSKVSSVDDPSNYSTGAQWRFQLDVDL